MENEICSNCGETYRYTTAKHECKPRKLTTRKEISPERLEEIIRVSNLCNCARAYYESTLLGAKEILHKENISFLAKAIKAELGGINV